jgi:hypothetical protein
MLLRAPRPAAAEAAGVEVARAPAAEPARPSLAAHSSSAAPKPSQKGKGRLRARSLGAGMHATGCARLRQGAPAGCAGTPARALRPAGSAGRSRTSQACRTRRAALSGALAHLTACVAARPARLGTCAALLGPPAGSVGRSTVSGRSLDHRDAHTANGRGKRCMRGPCPGHRLCQTTGRGAF